MALKNIILFSLVFLLLVTPIMATSLKDIEPQQINLAQVLDSSYIVKEDGVYFKNLKQNNPIVWVDKKVGTTYHVDSVKDFDKEQNESVTLEFFYDVQPDYIKHITHSGKFDRYYFPTQWDWTPNCISEEECNGGWVSIEVENIERGFGSSTFPIGIDGAQWARDGQFYGEFDGIGTNIDVGNTIVINLNKSLGYSHFAWAKDLGDDESDQGETILRGGSSGLDTFGMTLSNNNLNLICLSQINGTLHQTNKAHGVTSSDWNYYGCVFNSTDLIYYVNGIEIAKVDVLDGGSLNLSGSNLFLGARPSGDSQSFNGSIDELLIYNRSLSQAEITALFNNYTVTSLGVDRTSQHSVEGLVLDINFDDFSVADNSGQANHGINTNVSFGVVEDINITLTDGTDYKFTPTTFQIINDNLAWTGIFVDYTYTDGEFEEFGFHISILKLVAGFVALALLTVSILYLFKLLRENGIIS